MRNRSLSVAVAGIVTAAFCIIVADVRTGRAGEPAPAVSTPTVATPAAVPNTRQYLVLVQHGEQLEQALGTGMEMMQGGPLPARGFTVIVMGDGVMALAKGSQLEPMLTDARGRGLRIAACRIAMDRQKLRPTDLVPAAEPVPNGLIETFRMKALGHMSLEL